MARRCCGIKARALNPSWQKDTMAPAAHEGVAQLLGNYSSI